jgi:hypothetical protein
MAAAVTAFAERRRAHRREPNDDEPIARLRLRAGRELTVVNVGATGALVETEGRLLPGTCVDVHVITGDGRQLVRSRVVRAFVSTLAADRIIYRGALAFDRWVDIAPGYPFPDGGDRVGAAAGSGYPPGAFGLLEVE